jgi:hypothetical protein
VKRKRGSAEGKVKKRKRETYEDVGTGTLEEGSDTLSLDDLATSVAV